jgi:hypothetical protein
MKSLTGVVKSMTVVAALVSVPAFANDWSACQKDLKAHCKDAKDDAAKTACIDKLDGEKKLSKSCKAAHEKMAKTAAPAGEAHPAAATEPAKEEGKAE